jgi:hypothetical protein
LAGLRAAPIKGFAVLGVRRPEVGFVGGPGRDDEHDRVRVPPSRYPEGDPTKWET